jgi:flagellar hook-basal body complex protein FliE
MPIEASFAAKLYESAQRIAMPEGAPDEKGPSARSGSFSDALAAAAGNMAQTMRSGEEAARAAMTGQADVQSVVEALTATELALQTAVAVRDRVVEAYQEVLRMPV